MASIVLGSQAAVRASTGRQLRGGSGTPRALPRTQVPRAGAFSFGSDTNEPQTVRSVRSCADGELCGMLVVVLDTGVFVAQPRMR
eukprot:2479057-Pyramimonas_sp.AAC.2